MRLAAKSRLVAKLRIVAKMRLVARFVTKLRLWLIWELKQSLDFR